MSVLWGLLRRKSENEEQARAPEENYRDVLDKDMVAVNSANTTEAIDKAIAKCKADLEIYKSRGENIVEVQGMLDCYIATRARRIGK